MREMVMWEQWDQKEEHQRAKQYGEEEILPEMRKLQRRCKALLFSIITEHNVRKYKKFKTRLKLLREEICPHPKFAAISQDGSSECCSICGRGRDADGCQKVFTSTRGRKLVNKEPKLRKRPCNKEKRSGRTSEASKVRRVRERLEAKRDSANKQLKELQDQICKHPSKNFEFDAIEKVYKGNCDDCNKPIESKEKVGGDYF
jgi:hypothetical protein